MRKMSAGTNLLPNSQLLKKGEHSVSLRRPEAVPKLPQLTPQPQSPHDVLKGFW